MIRTTIGAPERDEIAESIGSRGNCEISGSWRCNTCAPVVVTGNWCQLSSFGPGARKIGVNSFFLGRGRH
jgi:hypothetical protein